MQKAKYILYIVAILSIFLMFSGDSAFAEDVDYNVTIAPALTLTTTTNSLVLNLDPSSKTFESKTLTVSAGTNNKTGYTLTLSTPNDNTDLDRNSSADSITATIPTLASGTYTESTFTADRWGYKINSNTSLPSIITTDYIPFVSGNTLMESSTAINHDETELAFAAKIDYLQPAGAYNTTLQFNMVANPDIQNIQNLDPSFCTAVPITVIDERDNEEYLVQRLADGNCWLLDNLRLDISDPAIQTKLDSTTTNATDATLNYLINGGGTSPYATTSVSSTYGDSYIAPKIVLDYKDTVVSGTGLGSKKAGVYYNYCAVSAGSYCYAAAAGSGPALYDICPRGWHLPTSAEYTALFSSYPDRSAFKEAFSVQLSGAIGNKGATMWQESYGMFWSKTFANSYYMYYLWINDETVAMMYYLQGYATYRNWGMPIRCVAS
ncbi:hypothetical protein IJI86_01225 [Candidatus Saccharibacteria bacterium]|nr:hypothetical protein [Candidatus Saccharibacteria bacterium]